MQPPRIILYSGPLGMIFMSFVVFVFLFYFGSINMSFATRGVVVDGVVKDVVRDTTYSSSRSHREPVYYAVISYADTSGQQREFQASSGSTQNAYPVGSKVSVVYDATDPSHVTINSFMSIWGGPIIVGFFALTFLTLGVGGLIRAHKISKTTVTV